MAQGKLVPTVFQDHYSRFAQAHASKFSTDLAEVSTRFLSELMQLGGAFSQEHRQREASAPPEPEIVPPRFDPANPARWFEQLGEYAGHLNSRAVKAYREQLDRVAAGATTPSEIQQDATDYLARQMPDYLQHLTKLYFGLLNELNELRSGYEETYFQGVLAAAKSTDTHPPVVLNLTAPVGSTASASLSVANTTGQRTKLSYLLTDIRRADGQGPAFTPAFSVTPESLELAPGEEQWVDFSLVLPAHQYDPEALYTGTLLIHGNPNLRVEVQLRIIAISLTPSAAASGQKGS